ncbi:hypothetical protein ALC56_03877, partial [Trachymyrmex septentrionalis]
RLFAESVNWFRVGTLPLPSSARLCLVEVIYRSEEAGRDVKDGQQYCGMHIPRAFGTLIPYTSAAWYYVISQINERKAVRNGREIYLENMPLESREPSTDRRA